MAENKVVVIPEGKVYDYIDSKFRNDTPEEYVRQTIEKRLVNEHKYAPAQVKIEFALQVGSNKPRADIVIWEKDATEQTQGTIKLIIECKKETVDARNAKDGIAQLQSYMSVCPNCDWGMWTNSIQKFVFRNEVCLFLSDYSIVFFWLVLLSRFVFFLGSHLKLNLTNH